MPKSSSDMFLIKSSGLYGLGTSYMLDTQVYILIFVSPVASIKQGIGIAFMVLASSSVKFSGSAQWH